MKKYLIICVSLLALAGCFSGTTPPSQFYTLSPTLTESISDQQMIIGIDRIQVPRALERPQMLIADAHSPEMTVSELNRWIEPLPGLIQRTLIMDLNTALPNAQIRNKSFSNPPDDYSIFVDIIQLGAILNDKASLLADVNIRTANGQSVAYIKVNESVPIGGSYVDVANGQSTLIGHLATLIADKLATQKK
ncbi:MAG: membrane integrity-associated transporter subunit PqiC [Alphaproteobacteria bacterium]